MTEPLPATGELAPVAAPYDLIDLSEGAQPDPGSVRPRIVVDKAGFKVLRLALLPGQRMPTHDHVGCHVTIQCLAGTAHVELDGESVTMTPGKLLRFDGESRVSPGNGGSTECAMLISLVARSTEQPS